MKRRIALWITTIAACSAMMAMTSFGAVSTPHVFGDNMVLQRGMPIPIWGHATPGDEITVKFLGRTATTHAGADGKWIVRLPTIEKGGPAVLTITSKSSDGAVPGNTLTFANVVVGEVWICSGQSNMQWPVSHAMNAEKEIASAKNPKIRLLDIPHVTSIVAADDVKAQWTVCSPASVSNFSAVGYFFGRSLYEHLKVPIGLINSSWGGTRIEPWTPLSELQKMPEVASQLTNLDEKVILKLQKEYDDKWALQQKAHLRIIDLEQDEAMTRAMAAPELDTTGWKKMILPTPWEKAGLPNYDGLVWFRKNIVLPAEWAGKDLVLHLGPVDEDDVTSFNGVKIGGQGSYKTLDVSNWDKPRVYKVPGSLVRAGVNVLAVRVIDSSYSGGLWGSKAEEMKLELAGAPTVSVAGEWLYKPEQTLFTIPKAPVTSSTATAIYNGMIRPLIPYAIRGAIWYQGESNWGDGMLYRDKMRAMIKGWRDAWQEGPFPFYYVQIAPFIYRANDATGLPKLWQAQKSALEIENTGMAVITDLANVRDIHPVRKQEVGRRLSLWALNKTYGFKDIECSGPLYKNTVVTNGEVRIQFDHAQSGLASSDGETIAWFDMGETTGTMNRVIGRIEGSEVVIPYGMKTIPFVRFGWHEMAQPNLINKEGLPASPFSTEPEETMRPASTPKH